MTKFIRIDKDAEDSGIVINVESIDAFYCLDGGGGKQVTLIYVKDHDKFTVEGNRVQEICDLIEKAGG